MWIIELGRISGKITTFKTFQIRPSTNYQISSPSDLYKILSPRNTHHCGVDDAAEAESSILKFQNYCVNSLVTLFIKGMKYKKKDD